MSFSKIIASGVIAVALFGASVASAQSYYPSYNTGSTGCASISSTLSYGSSGSQVRSLQTFLVSQNYPGGGSWMITGYFGTATAAAVRDFQQAHGLPQTGAVDSPTLAALNSCGGNYLPGLGGTGYNYTNPYSSNYNSYTSNTYQPYQYTTPYNNNYNSGYSYNTNYGCGTYPYYYSCGTSYGTTPHLTSLSVTSAAPGQAVTVYGTGFDAINNTVYVGGTTLFTVPSNGGTSLTFTIPTNANNVVSVSVANSYGTSNAITLSILGSGVVCNSYPYTTNCAPPPYPCTSTYGYNYGNTCPPNNTGAPTITYLSPQQGGVGTAVTVYGSGFTSSGNTLHFGNGLIANLSSFDGRSVSFTVPSTISGYGYQPIGLGSYNISVTNGAGITSNIMPFTITTLGSTGAATITGITGPSNLGVGVAGTWSVTIQNPSNNYVTTSVAWGDTNNGYVNQAAPQTTYTQGATTVTFTHAYYAAGTYTITFTVSNGSSQSNTSSETVYVSGSGSTGSISLTALSPISGPVGTQVILQGTGFDALNNTVHFGVGGTMHVPAQNGVIYFTIPSYVSVCDVNVGTQCFAAQQVTQGSYPIYVTSPLGTSNTLNFQVQ